MREGGHIHGFCLEHVHIHVGEYLVSELREGFFGQAFSGAKELVKLGGSSNPASKAVLFCADFAKAIVNMSKEQSNAQSILDDGRTLVGDAILGLYTNLLQLHGVAAEEYGRQTLTSSLFGREPPTIWRTSLRTTVDTIPALNAVNATARVYNRDYPELDSLPDPFWASPVDSSCHGTHTSVPCGSPCLSAELSLAATNLRFRRDL